MDFASIIGIILGVGSIALGYVMDEGNLAALLLLSAAVIVFGGSFGSVILSYGMNQLKRMPALFFQAFRTPKSKIPKIIDFLVVLSESARKDGLLSLEKIIENEQAKGPIDPLLKRGAMMVIDGTDLEQIRELLENEISLFEQKEKIDISMFESLGGYGPAYGMIATIAGLIRVLANMSSPEQMAESIGVAFTATLYGVVFANAVCLPVANKLTTKLNRYILEKEMIVEGICAIRNGVNPKMLREKLSPYLLFDSKKKRGKGA